MKMAKFLVSHFDAGEVKFKAGQHYPLTDETRLCIARGAAVEVDAPEETAAADEAKPAEAEAVTDAKPAKGKK